MECISQLFGAGGIEHCVKNLDGVFAFVLVDSKEQRAYVARDPYGVRPLFRLVSDVGVVGFSSEAKGKFHFIDTYFHLNVFSLFAFFLLLTVLFVIYIMWFYLIRR